MAQRENNYAFIDSQNLHFGISKLGWKIDYRKFRVYLSDKYSVKRAFMFIGYVEENQGMYDGLKLAGFELKFKPTVRDSGGKIKGNVDADLVLAAVLMIREYDKAVIVTSDGDFYSLVEHLISTNKLKKLLSVHIDKCSSLLKISARENIDYISELKYKIEYPKTKKGTA